MNNLDNYSRMGSLDQINKKSKIVRFLNGALYRSAEEDLIDQMENVFESKMKARTWYYKSNACLNGNSPREYCGKGRGEEVNDLLEHIKNGVF